MTITKEHALYIEFSCGCALRVLNLFEKKYLKDKRPRKAIIAAWNFFLEPTDKNKKAAAYAADTAADAADTAADAADTAAYAAYTAADAADTAAYAAYTAAGAADTAAYAAGAAAYAAGAAYAAAYTAAGAADEIKWQVEFLAMLNIKYDLKIQIRGVEGDKLK